MTGHRPFKELTEGFCDARKARVTARFDVMSASGSFQRTVQARALRDAKFRQALLVEAMQALGDGNLEEGRAALRSYVRAMVGFEDFTQT
jgi:hypothetical protein